MSEPFRLPDKTDVFEFEEGDYRGAEIVLRLSPVPLGVFMDINRRIERRSEWKDLEELETLYREFANAALVSWNLVERDGKPIPATSDGMLQLDVGIGASLIGTWISAVSRVAAPLGLRSRGGAMSKATRASRSRSSSSRRKTS